MPPELAPPTLRFLIAGAAIALFVVLLFVAVARRSPRPPPRWPSVLGLLLLVVGFAAAWFALRGPRAKRLPPRESLRAARQAALDAIAGKRESAVNGFRAAVPDVARAGWRSVARSLEDAAAFVEDMSPVDEGTTLGLLPEAAYRPVLRRAEAGVFQVLYEHQDGLVLLFATDVDSEDRVAPQVTEVDDRFLVAATQPVPGGSYRVFGLLSNREGARELERHLGQTDLWVPPRTLVEPPSERDPPAFPFRPPPLVETGR